MLSQTFKKILLPIGVAAALFASLGDAAGAPPAKIEFNRDIRPILSDNCFACHGPDQNKRKAKLRLDERESALEKEAFKPGDPENSELIIRLFSADADEVMPPPDSHKKLSAGQKELLQRWVAEGAEYQPHWAYITPRRPAVPELREGADPARRAANAIDAFVFRKLEEKGIEPSREADKRTLLRRLSLDLTGLPPTVGDVRDFVADERPRAYESAVERLLASPHYGERMAVPWLDVVRYADTVGYHGDQNQNVFPYRDYVIDAFNSNKPFDQFTIEQLAGDLLPRATQEQRIATCFNRLNMMTREGGAQPKEYLAKYAADRVRTVSSAWLGSTMGCAECHDHKFDPFSIKDFYALSAFFADIKQWGVYSDYRYTPEPELKGVTNDHPFPPEMEVESRYLKERAERLRRRVQELARKDQADPKLRQAFDEWRASSLAFLQASPDGWQTPAPVVTFPPPGAVKGKDAKAARRASKRNPATPVAPAAAPAETTSDAKNPAAAPAPPPGFRIGEDNRITFGENAGDNPKLILQPATPWLAAIRVELLPEAGVVFRGSEENITIKLAAALLRTGETKPIALPVRYAEANVREPRYSGGSEILGVHDGWMLTRNAKGPCTSVWLLDQPFAVNPGDTLTLEFTGVRTRTLRVSVSPLAPEPALNSEYARKLAAALAASSGTASGADPSISECRLAWLRGTGANPTVFGQLKSLERAIVECQESRAKTLVTQSVPPAVTRVLPRGNWQDQSGAIVSPMTPHFLPMPMNSEDRRLTRLDLAQWLVAPENPLTARVFVNRLWRQFFGSGLSAVADDLGAQGEWPTHPELLDWLAVEFRESGWDVKRLVKLMVESATYRQEANLRRDLREVDPANRLLASQNPRRLEAEFVRDNALAIAGLLNRDVGGPSAQPYQPAGYYALLQFPDRDYLANNDERQYRRGVYMHWQRTFMHPMLANFDAPSREECTAARTVANTPQQALTLLNDPSFVEAARVFAERLLALPAQKDEHRLQFIFETVLARVPRPKEQRSLTAFLATQREHYEANPEEAEKLTRVGLAPRPAAAASPAELAAWTTVCRVVLNLHETITRF